ncbi:hypothetical protein COY27_04340 [Candidatus Woesearchaeota archaeon CG_4_10_14_0_2_um_filter_33_13]|nr:MAG: hypothetical protein COY27_04340 [Candidatus Woesearchaeota archaeon CG_4_10_14_0_2_um_filter_33_13]
MDKKINRLRKEHLQFIFRNQEIKKLCAKDAMIRPVFLYPEDSTNIILSKLKNENVNACIVVDKNKHFLGEICEEDIIHLFIQQIKTEPLVQMINQGYKREFHYKSAKELMNKHKHLVKLNTPINKVVELVHKAGFRYIPVINDDKVVLGVVTPSSIINLLRNN